MATDAENRAKLKQALTQAAAQYGTSLSDSAIDFFVDRAMSHINARFTSQALRDQEINSAVASAGRLMQNLRPTINESISKRMFLDDAQNYVRAATNCFYPFCRPSP